MYDITQRVNINLYSYTYNTYLRACMYIDAYETMIFLISRRERTLEIAMKSFLLFLFPLLFPSSARPPVRPPARPSIGPLTSVHFSAACIPTCVRARHRHTDVFLLRGSSKERSMKRSRLSNDTTMQTREKKKIKHLLFVYRDQVSDLFLRTRLPA